MIAVSASRWRFDVRPLGDLSEIGVTGTPFVGRWYYAVMVEGPRGAVYKVDLIERDGRPHYPFAVKRRGRCVAHGPLRKAIELAAVEAIS